MDQQYFRFHKRGVKPNRFLLKTENFPSVPKTFKNILEICLIHRNPASAQLSVRFVYMFKIISVTVKAPNSIKQQLKHGSLENKRESNKSLPLHLDISRK